MEEFDQGFSFERKSGYDAVEGLTRTRSSRYKRNAERRNYTAWNRPAPDLRMQLYHPHPLPRNSRQAVQPWKYKASFDCEQPTIGPRSKTEPAMIPSMRDAIFGAEEKEQQIVVPAKVLRPWEAQILFVKEGMLPKGRYYNPKPHDHRGYPPIQSLGLPEFATSYEKDPYNIKFKSNNLDQVYGLPGSLRDVLPGRQLGDHVLKQPPKWEKCLHLPRGPYPTKAQQTTRHRPLDRSPHSAFMQRVEHKLSHQWASERAAMKTAPDTIGNT